MEVKVERRIKLLHRHVALLGQMLMMAPKGYKTNAPEDMVVIAVRQTPDMLVQGVVELVVHSTEFGDVPEGDDTPVMDPLEFGSVDKIVLL